LFADLASPKAKVVVAALQGLEKGYPNDPIAQDKIKAMLTDDRSTVRCKAARVLGAIHAKVSREDVKKITALLSGTKEEKGEGLKALRGLDAPEAVPAILPLLKDPDNNVKRDACRTLAVLGDKSVIPDIQPLQNDPSTAVQKDANDAIFAIQHK
jgi:HEAT repeat protein